MTLIQNINMEIIINNNAELLDFIKREDIALEQVAEVVCRFLKVVWYSGKTKEQLIDSTEYYINKFCKNDNLERPMFLEQREHIFNIKDFYKT